MPGRMSFTQEIADEICERIAGGESLRSICQDAALPGMTTVFKWLGENDEFAKQYARAREQQADAFADEIVAIADMPIDPNVARVRIDARKWAAGKMRPKVYGEKVTNELTGPDGAALPPTQIIVQAVRASHDDESLV